MQHPSGQISTGFFSPQSVSTEDFGFDVERARGVDRAYFLDGQKNQPYHPSYFVVATTGGIG